MHSGCGLSSVLSPARVKLALVSLNDSTDVLPWSGLNYHIARSLERAGATLVRVGPLTHPWTTGMKLRRRWYGLWRHAYHANMEPSALGAFGAQARAQIPGDVDAVVAVTTLIAASLDGLRAPVISWDDASPASLIEYYPQYERLSARTARDIVAMGRRAAQNVQLAMYASEWAAADARAAYDLPLDRVAVVPFGANLETLPSTDDVHRAIAARPRTRCQLLWVGVDWERKRGDLVLEIAQRIEAHGIPVELTVVGCRPPGDRELPEWVHVEGWVSKRTAVGRARLAELYERSHLLVMPSNAEAYGLVYAEAAAYGVPSVATRTGGVPTVVVDGETGILDDPGAGAESYAGRILGLLKDRPRYEVMARAAAERSATMLNWDVAGREAVARIAAVAGVAAGRRERPRRMALTPI